jgi:hypothetical protein
MALSGDVSSDCNLVSIRQARFFDFFNEIGAFSSFAACSDKSLLTEREAALRLGGGNFLHAPNRS